jgi:hypothetical protein
MQANTRSPDIRSLHWSSKHNIRAVRVSAPALPQQHGQHVVLHLDAVADCSAVTLVSCAEARQGLEGEALACACNKGNMHIMAAGMCNRCSSPPVARQDHSQPPTSLTQGINLAVCTLLSE